LRLHDEQSAAVAAALADPGLAVDLQPAADVVGTAARLEEADSELAQAQQAAAVACGRATALEELLPEWEELTARLLPAQEEAQAVRQLADLCAGTATANSLRMTLSSFVLASRLEEVAAAASARLLTMSQGRFSLVHTDGSARGGARAGLGLLARDSWTGQDRETSTLSGGETFLASLALALGLADVATAEAGGTRIDALFVDEGFGSLDGDTLDEVMDVLDGLREGGRIVGLVSHVAELKARIPAQVKVRKTRAGSDLVVSGC
ncbi:MAG: SMC family ATPase, partial [Actinomycetota bacterium]|nr:SMC family ATPase [Actinomycetota bacterium]